MKEHFCSHFPSHKSDGESVSLILSQCCCKGQLCKCTRPLSIVSHEPKTLFDMRCRDMFRTDVYQQSLIGLAIDEAHCIKEWRVAVA